MAIRGSLKEASLPDVLQLLSMGKKTGCLSVTHRNNFGSIYFEKGRITYASIVNRRDRLGDMLVKNDVVTQMQLDTAIETQHRAREKRVGEILVETGAISQERLAHFIRVQIEEAVYFLFTWMQGTFNFEADVHPDPQDLVVSINPESLLLEGARRLDEWGLIEKKVPSFDVVFEVDRAKVLASDATLTEEQQVVLRLVDGVRDVQGIIDASGLVEFEVGKAIYGLVIAGFAHRIGTSSRPSIAGGLAEHRTEEHRNLGIALYRTGMLDEALREFRRVLELRTGDHSATVYLGLIFLRQAKWPEAIRTLVEASNQPGAKYTVFHNLAFAYEHSGNLAEARTAILEAIERGGSSDPRVHTSRGIIELLAGDIEAADAAFSAARIEAGDAPPSAPWFHYAALAAALGGDLSRAATILTSGVGAHARAAALANNLAVVFEKQGMLPEARQQLDHGAQEDPSLPQLAKNLGDLFYRSGQYDDALEAYGRATKLRPELGPDVHLKIGNIRFRRDERDEAVRAWERSLELDPHNAIARANLTAVQHAS